MKKNIIFIAPPAAGKGTASDILGKRYGIAHISTGDLLREEISKGTEFGVRLQEVMNAGKLVDDETVTELLEKRLQQPDCDNGYMLDGYPRNLNQANILEALLERLGKPVNYVFYIDINREMAMKRACSRIQCRACGKIYNKYAEGMQPSVDKVCDDCGGEVYQREDDSEESFLKRFDTYINTTKPLVEFYKEKELLYFIDGNTDRFYTDEQIEEILNK